jgi:hypothetical protein
VLVLYPRGLLVFSTTALAFLTSMSEKRKSASPSAIQVKNRRQTIGIEGKLCVIMRLKECERMVDLCRNVGLARGIVHKIRENADRIKESAKPGTKVFVQQDYHCLIRINRTKNCGCESFTFLLH